MSERERLRRRFAELHGHGCFIMPNAWDVGSAKVLASLGFEAIATTSSGFAASLGRHDQQVLLGELAVHVADVCAAVAVPVNVDAEHGYHSDADPLAETVELLAAAGAAGLSIEDYVPGRGILSQDEAARRVRRVVEIADPLGVTVTARAENHLYDVDDLEDTIARLNAYQDAGAHVLYAPGLSDLEDVELVVGAVERPVNVLLLEGGPSVDQLADAGVRRVSTGGALAFLAYGAAANAARRLMEDGRLDLDAVLTRQERDDSFGV